MSERTPLEERPRVSRLRAGQWFAIGGAALVALLAACFALGIVAIDRLADARHRVIDENGPARVAGQELLTALVEQDSSVQGYGLTGRGGYLTTYRRAVAEERAATRTLTTLLAAIDDPALRADYDAVRAALADWRRAYADPTLARAGAGISPAEAAVGAARFAAVRAANARFDADLAARREAGRRDLESASSFLTSSLAAIAFLLVVALVAGALLLRSTVSRPLARLSRETRTTAEGDFEHAIHGDGARDIVDLGEDIGELRRRILLELEALQEANRRLDAQALELQRSNAELEQFAYVASHDLQEPLRKVASFTELLQRRYEGRLDERADQYIAFAIDGARRMQQLINDLLAFSRVGRGPQQPRVVAVGDVVEAALANLSAAIDETGATVSVGPLPSVRGEPGLLAAVFQNLIGNAVKFHGEDPPVVRVDAERDGDAWRFSVADNGIGIDPLDAERIFVIFQRLHPKDTYAGTGIGLALCRKIVEFHGGTIAVDTSIRAGARFVLTLPAADGDTTIA